MGLRLTEGLLTDTQGNPSQTNYPGALTGLLQAWNVFVHRPRKELTVSELEEMVAIERKVAASLYG